MHKILMPIDFSGAIDAVVQHASELCSKLDAEVCVLHVSGADHDDPKRGRAVLEPKIDAIVDRLTEAGCKASPKLVFGYTIPSILDQIDLLQPALVVVGSHSHSRVRDLLVGSVTQSLLHSAKCPVLVVPVPRPEPDPSVVQTSLDEWGGYPMF